MIAPQFEKLEIERIAWGDEKGKLKGRLRLSSKSGDVSLNLRPDLSERLLELARDAIIDSVEDAANAFIFELTTAIPTVPRIENREEGA